MMNRNVIHFKSINVMSTGQHKNNKYKWSVNPYSGGSYSQEGIDICTLMNVIVIILMLIITSSLYCVLFMYQML